MIQIRRAQAPEAALFTEISVRTFFETFAHHNDPKDMELYREATFSEEKQRREILDPKRRIAFAWADEEMAGFYHLHTESKDPSVQGPQQIELVRIYVDSKWHGRGVAAALMENALALAKTEGFETIWLGVWAKNYRAQAFYRKFGFEKVGTHPFTLGTQTQDDWIMARGL